MFAVSEAGENVKFFISTGGGVFTQATAFVTVSTNYGGDISFGELHWMFTASGLVITFNAACSATTSNDPWGPITMSKHRRIGSTGDAYHWDDEDASLGLGKSEDNSATFINNISNGLDSNRLYEDSVVCDDLFGINLMTVNNTGDRVKSGDGGYTFNEMTGLVSGGRFFDVVYGSMDHWGVAGGGTVQITSDFGVTWVDVTGNLTDLIATPVLGSFKFYAI